MTRKKVKVAWIENDAGRRASLKKRRVGLLKKVSELTVLCGVDAFCIIYSPDETEPVVWPSPSTIQQLISRYRDLPEIERYKKAMDQETYLKERIGKAKNQSKKHQKKNKDLDLSWYMQQVHEGRDLDDFDMDELQCFGWLLQERIYEYRKRLDYFQIVPPLPPALIPQQVPNMEDIGPSSGGDGQRVDASDPLLWNQWLHDTLMMHNNENVVGGVDMVLPYGFNMSGYGSNFGQMNMGNFYQENTRGNNLTSANLEILHGLGGLSMIGVLNSNLAGSHNDENIGISCGNWEGANDGSYNIQIGVGSNNGTNLDHLGFPNMGMDGRENEQTAWFFSKNMPGHGNDHYQIGLGHPKGNVTQEFGNTMQMGAMDGLGNMMELDPNHNIVEEHGSEMVTEFPIENIVRGHGNDQNDEGGDVGFQSSFFGVTSDMGLPFDVTKPWNNKHSS